MIAENPQSVERPRHSLDFSCGRYGLRLLAPKYAEIFRFAVGICRLFRCPLRPLPCHGDGPARQADLPGFQRMVNWFSVSVFWRRALSSSKRVAAIGYRSDPESSARRLLVADAARTESLCGPSAGACF